MEEIHCLYVYHFISNGQTWSWVTDIHPITLQHGSVEHLYKVQIRVIGKVFAPPVHRPDCQWYPVYQDIITPPYPYSKEYPFSITAKLWKRPFGPVRKVTQHGN